MRVSSLLFPPAESVFLLSTVVLNVEKSFSDNLWPYNLISFLHFLKKGNAVLKEGQNNGCMKICIRMKCLKASSERSRSSAVHALEVTI